MLARSVLEGNHTCGPWQEPGGHCSPYKEVCGSREGLVEVHRGQVMGVLQIQSEPHSDPRNKANGDISIPRIRLRLLCLPTTKQRPERMVHPTASQQVMLMQTALHIPSFPQLALWMQHTALWSQGARKKATKSQLWHKSLEPFNVRRKIPVRSSRFTFLH